LQRRELREETRLLILVNVLLPAFTPVMLRRGCSSFKGRYACTDTRGSVRRASGFVLTSKPEVGQSKPTSHQKSRVGKKREKPG
jgi:hypothetical protein